MKHQNSSKLFCKNRIINNNQKKFTNNNKNSIHIISQKESSLKDSSKIEDILNHPVLKRRLPPLDKSNQEKYNEEKFDNELKNSKNLQQQINYNIEKLKKSEIKKETEEFKDSLDLDKDTYNYNFKILEEMINKKEKIENNNKINTNKNNSKENKIKNDMGAGTPTYPDNIQDLKDEEIKKEIKQENIVKKEELIKDENKIEEIKHEDDSKEKNINEIKQDKNEINTKTEENTIESSNIETPKKNPEINSQSSLQEHYISARRKSIIDEDLIAKINPDEEITSSIESQITSLQKIISNLNIKNCYNL